jgi:PAS domain S-box-containing protein
MYEDRYKNFFRTSKDAVFITTKDGSWVDMNDAAVKLFGYENREELERIPIPKLYANPEDREQHIRLIEEKGFVKERPTKLRGKDGRLIDTLITSVAIKDESGNVTGFQGTIRDITEEKENNERLRRLNSLLLAIRNVNQTLVQEPDLQKLAQKTCEVLIDAQSYLSCSIALPDESGTIVPVANVHDEGFSKQWAITPAGVGEAPACLCDVLKSGEIHQRLGPEECEDCAFASPAEAYKAVTVPIKHENRTVGMLHVHVEKGLDLTSNELGLLKEVAADIGFARSKILAEHAFKESERQLATLIQNVPGMVYRCSTEPGWPMRFCSRGAKDLTGYSSDDITSGKVQYEQIIHPDDRQRVREEIEAAISEEKSFELEYRIITKNREQRWVTERGQAIPPGDGEHILIEGVVIDITERKKAEKAAKRSADFLGSILDALSAHIAVLDDSATIMQVNESWRRFADASGLGWKDYGVGRNYLAVIEEAIGESSEGAELAATGIRDLLAGRRDYFQIEYPCHSPDEKRWFVMKGTSFDATDGRWVVVAHENITQRRLAEEELRATQQQMIDQERQRALTQMASGIAHDFNNALSTIRGFSDLLLENPEKLCDVKTAKKYLTYIRKVTDNASQTVRRMRKFYRPRRDEDHRPVNLNRIVKEAIAMSMPKWQGRAQAADPQIELTEDLGDIDSISGNEVEIHDMITNLIFNAVDALPEGGNITLRTRQDDDTVIMEIGDNGLGMSENVLEHCMEPFFSTKHNGTGLGLAIAKSVVERHGGEISVESQEGEGTTFRIWLPVARKAEKPITTEEDNADIARGLRILVIEDNEEQRELMQEYLNIDNHDVELADNGHEGITRFMDGWYDLVITDRAMPGMSGDEVARQIKHYAPDKNIIMLTGFGDMMEATERKPKGVDLILSKPVTLEKLRKAISQVTGR